MKKEQPIKGWVRGGKRLPGLFTKVQWRNADGGNIPLPDATPLEHYQRAGSNINWHEWLDESQTPIHSGEERLFTLKEISEFAPWFKKNTAMKDEEGWIPTTFCGMDYKKSYTVEQFYKYFKEKSLLSREQKVNNEK